MTTLDFATELARAEAAFRPVRVPALASFSPEVQLGVAAAGIDEAAFLEALMALADEPVSPSGLSGLTCAGEHIAQGVEFVPLEIDGTDAELNWWAVCALEFLPAFRNHFARSWLREVCERLADVEIEDMVDDSEREPEECGQFWSPEPRR